MPRHSETSNRSHYWVPYTILAFLVSNNPLGYYISEQILCKFIQTRTKLEPITRSLEHPEFPCGVPKSSPFVGLLSPDSEISGHRRVSIPLHFRVVCSRAHVSLINPIKRHLCWFCVYPKPHICYSTSSQLRMNYTIVKWFGQNRQFGPGYRCLVQVLGT